MKLTQAAVLAILAYKTAVSANSPKPPSSIRARDDHTQSNGLYARDAYGIDNDDDFDLYARDAEAEADDDFSDDLHPVNEFVQSKVSLRESCQLFK